MKILKQLAGKDIIERKLIVKIKNNTIHSNTQLQYYPLKYSKKMKIMMKIKIKKQY